MTDSWLQDSEVRRVVDELNGFYQDIYEFHPFLVGWYNETIDDHGTFDLPFERSVLAIIIFTLPQYFERVYVPWLRLHYEPTMRDPVDKCFKDQILGIKAQLGQRILRCRWDKEAALVDTAYVANCSPKAHTREELTTFEETNGNVDAIEMRTVFDFDLNPVRRNPCIIMQVAAHVAGGAFYYRAVNLPADKYAEVERACGRKPAGVSLHPRFGGWFAMRAVLILPHCGAALKQRAPVDPLEGDVEACMQLLTAWTRDWRDSAWRNAIGRLQLSANERYSDLQTRYFASAANDRERRRVIEELLLGTAEAEGTTMEDRDQIEQLNGSSVYIAPRAVSTYASGS